MIDKLQDLVIGDLLRMVTVGNAPGYELIHVTVLNLDAGLRVASGLLSTLKVH